MEGVKLLVTWLSESHNPVDEKPLEEHPRIIEFLGLIKNKLSRGEAASAIPESVVTECKAYGSVVNTPKDIVTATVCSVCQEKFDHTIKLLYHMLHMHKMNPVHFICKNLRAKPVRCGECQVPCMSPVVYALHTDQHTLKKHLECPECHKKYYTTTKYYSDDMCGDNAFPKAVKEHVNGAVKRLQGLEEDTEIIGENFTMHFTKYAKRPIINELPRNYINRMAPKGRRSRAGRKKKPANNDCIPETVEEWVINMPSMLDARVSLSLMDVVRGENQFDEEFEWVEADEVVDGEPGSEDKEVKEKYKCHLCAETFTFSWGLNSHYRKRHSCATHTCETCKKTFATKIDKDQHAIIHRQAKLAGPRSRSGSPKKEVKEETPAIKQELWWEQPGAMAPLQPLTTTPTKDSQQSPPSEKPSPRSRKVRLGSSSATSPRCGPPPILDRFHCLDCEVCSEDCDHTDHALTLREGDMAQHVLTTGHRRVREAGEVRAQTEARVQVMSLAYSSVYGNKVRKLWKNLAKSDLLTSASYDFQNPNKCKVRECSYKGKNAMEMFRHIREVHLTEIKKLKIKIGGKPASSEEAKKKLSLPKPGPRSKTKLKQTVFPFNIFGSTAAKDEVKEEPAEIKTEIKTEEPEPIVQEQARRPSKEGNSRRDQNPEESEGILCPNQAITLTLKSTGFRIRLSTEADYEPEDPQEEETGDDEAAAEEVGGDDESKEEEVVHQEYVPEHVEPEDVAMDDSFVEEPSFDSTMENMAEEEAPIEVDPTKDWHVDDEEDPAEVSLNTSDPYSIDEFDE